MTLSGAASEVQDNPALELIDVFQRGNFSKEPLIRDVLTAVGSEEAEAFFERAYVSGVLTSHPHNGEGLLCIIALTKHDSVRRMACEKFGYMLSSLYWSPEYCREASAKFELLKSYFFR